MRVLKFLPWYNQGVWSSWMWHGVAGKQVPTVQRNVSLSRSIVNKSQFLHRPWTLVPLVHLCFLFRRGREASTRGHPKLMVLLMHWMRGKVTWCKRLMTLYINLPVAILGKETEAFTCFLLWAINSLNNNGSYLSVFIFKTENNWMTTEHKKEPLIFQIVFLYGSQNCKVCNKLQHVSSKIMLTNTVIIMFT